MKAQYKPTFDSEWLDWPYWNGPTEYECSAVEAGEPLFWRPEVGASTVRLMAFRWADGREWASGVAALAAGGTSLADVLKRFYADRGRAATIWPGQSSDAVARQYGKSKAYRGLLDNMSKAYRGLLDNMKTASVIGWDMAIDEAAKVDLEAYAAKEYRRQLKDGKWSWIGVPEKEQGPPEPRISYRDDCRIGLIDVDDALTTEEIAKRFSLISFVPDALFGYVAGGRRFRGTSPKFQVFDGQGVTPKYRLTVSRDPETGCDVATVERVE